MDCRQYWPMQLFSYLVPLKARQLQNVQPLFDHENEHDTAGFDQITI